MVFIKKRMELVENLIVIIQRIGQVKKVSVMKLVTKGTIEEKIIELQEKKKYLANNLLEGNDDSKIINFLIEKDVKNLLLFSGEEL